jgi:uncharacterized protein (DUF488 family)
MTDMPLVLTLGHSNHAWTEFVALLQANEVACLIDVRSMPASRRYPQFNRAGRPKDTVCYAGGAVDYARVAATRAFQGGLDEAADLARARRCCLMCAERDPLDCHRAILVARHLAPKGFSITHVHGDGRLETQGEFERRLVAADEAPLLAGVEDSRALLPLAYNRRGRKMAFRA